MVLKTKVIEGFDRLNLESNINKFLETIQEKDFIDIKLTSAPRENVTQQIYIVIIVYRED